MPDIISFDEPVESAPRFDLRWRGYARDQVDDHLDRILDGHQRSIEQYEAALQETLTQLDRVQSDRERLIAALAAPVAEPASVSCRVEAIFAAARAEAAQITDQATAVLREADERASTARRDFEIALAARRREQNAMTTTTTSTISTTGTVGTTDVSADDAGARPRKAARKTARQQHPAPAG